jgi:hypothetical protein
MPKWQINKLGKRKSVMAVKLNKAQKEILASYATAVNGIVYLTKAQGEPLQKAGLIMVNTQMMQGDKAATMLTDAGKAEADKLAPATTQVAPVATQSNFAIIEGVELPPVKRGFGGGNRAGAPPKYPFADMPVGASFFVPNSAEVPDAVKTMGSTVSNQNKKYAEVVMENGQPKMKSVTRTVRGEGNKAKLDENGKPIKETKAVPVMQATRKFTCRPVKAGTTYGAWTAPSDGALIQRTV